jgi:hypothetical protein
MPRITALCLGFGLIVLKILKSWQRFGLLIAAVILTNLIAWYVLTDNQQNGVYPHDGDTIMIPIMGIMYWSLIALPFFTIIGWLPSLKFAWRLFYKNLILSLLIGFTVLAIYISALFLSLLGVLSWAYPHHYLIALSYVLLISIIFICFFLDLKVVIQNRSTHAVK